MSISKYIRHEVKRRYGLKVSTRHLNMAVGAMMLVLVFLYLYIWPILLGLWKMWRISYLLEEVDIGEDTYNPIPMSQQRVPAIIHHMAPNEQNLPAQWQNSHDSCLGVHQRFEGNDKYQFKMWHDDDLRSFISDHYPWFLETYDAYPQMIQRVDAARYFLLRKYGGIYVDLDVGCKRSLDNLRRMPETGMIMPETSPLGLRNDFLVAAKEHPFLVYVTERLQGWAVKRWYSDFFTVVLSTGPIFLSLAAYDFTKEAPLLSKDMGLFSYKDYTENVLFHLGGSSWLHTDGRLIAALVNNIFMLMFMLATCVCCYYCKRQGTLDRMSKKVGMKNVNTMSELVGVVAETGLDKVRSLTNRIPKMNPEYVKGARIVRESIADVMKADAKGKKRKSAPPKPPSRWRFGEAERDELGNPIRNKLSHDRGAREADNGDSTGSGSDSDDMIYPMWANGEYSDGDDDDDEDDDDAVADERTSLV
eukprot:GSChrysophyteH1.ASY1.ANO1.1428.1 assembled CDS